jgi:lysophospholipase L1-like esterase
MLNRHVSAFVMIIACSLLAISTRAGEAPDEPATKKGKDGKDQPGFISRHEGFVASAKKGQCDFLLMGDSITDGWNNKKAIYEQAFGSYKPLNFGIGGDRTQHVLWRLQNGELEGISPKVMMLMIGTNNSGGDSAEKIAAGVTAIVNYTKQKSPKTKILLLAIFPRGEKPTPVRDKLKQVNDTIAKLDDGGKTVKYLDIGAKFLQPDGTISKDIMPDFLHLSDAGYKIWADAVKDTLAEMMK